jgi:hypothetical protein
LEQVLRLVPLPLMTVRGVANYPRIMQAILDTGFKGYVAQEFVPKHPDALASLRQGVRICEV